MKSLTLHSSVRPGRIAVFVDTADPFWVYTCINLLGYFARLWGGYGNIVVPTNGKTIDPLFWSILEKFDPDYLYIYRSTGRDLELRDQKAFDQWASSNVEKWAHDYGNSEFARDEIRKMLRDNQFGSFAISAELQAELKNRLAPFFFENFAVDTGFLTAESTGHYPHTDLVDILSNTHHPATVLSASPKLEPMDRLWISAMTGVCSSASVGAFKDTSVEIMEIGDVRGTNSFNAGVRQVVSFFLEGGSQFTVQTDLNDIRTVSATLSRLSLLNLGQYRSTKSLGYTFRTIVVAGASLADFCLYFALSRMRERVFWAIPSLSEIASQGRELAFDGGAEFIFASSLWSSARFATDHADGLDIVSASLDPHGVEIFRAALGKAALSEIPARFMAAGGEIPRHPLRYYESVGAWTPSAVLVPEDGVVELFDTPIAKTLSNPDARRHRWIVEVSSMNSMLPRHPALGTWVARGMAGTTHEVRMSASGLAYFCQNLMIMGGQDIASTLARPNIKIPDAKELFAFLATSAGLECTISDKGFYAEDLIAKLGGLEEASSFFRSVAGSRLVAAFLDKVKPEKDCNDRGVLLDDRRYHDHASLERALENRDLATRYIDDFAKRLIFYRGFIFQCAFCKNAGWFPVGGVDDSFSCPRCHRTQVFTSQHWKSGVAPSWYHQLDEIVYQAFLNDSHVPILALDYLRRTSNLQESFIFVDELKYRNIRGQQLVIECDLNCVCDGVLTIGEAKKSDRLAGTRKSETEMLGRYKELAVRIGARRIVFATEAEKWNPETRGKIFDAFSGTIVDPLLIARSELYG